jgi:hypothetical protein
LLLITEENAGLGTGRWLPLSKEHWTRVSTSSLVAAEADTR